jgi:uncharacterized membrane protein
VIGLRKSLGGNMSLLELLVLERMNRESGGSGCGGCLGIFVLVVVLAFISDFVTTHKKGILIFLLVLFILFLAIKFLLYLMDCYIYKDETPEEREERLKTEKMIRDWKRKY